MHASGRVYSRARYRRCITCIFCLLIGYTIILGLRFPRARYRFMPTSPSKHTATGWKSLPPPIRIPVSKSGHWLQEVSSSGHSASSIHHGLRSALKGLETPVAPIDANTNTFTIPSPIHPVSIGREQSYWNPTIIGLPSDAPAEYLVVARILTNGAYQQNVMCFANWTEADYGISCLSNPQIIHVAPTATRQCGHKSSGTWKVLANIPGFHDGRLMWSERGEIMIIVGIQSKYTCFALSLMTLTSPSFPDIYSINPESPISFPKLTELSRPPPYSPMEKNWLLFFAPEYGTYVQYELTPSKRTIAKLIGNGYTTSNLTSPAEIPCLCHPYPFDQARADGGALTGDKDDHAGLGGWHQATNSLRVILCNRDDHTCIAQPGMDVFMAIIQRKRHNSYGILSRYERVAVVWEGKPPFRILAIGKAKFLFQGETWTQPGGQSRKSEATRNPKMPSDSPIPPPEAKAKAERDIKGNSIRNPPFLFALSIAFDHPRGYRTGKVYHSGPQEMYMGYLDDFLVVSLGIGDSGTGLARMMVQDLISGVAICPGFASVG